MGLIGRKTLGIISYLLNLCVFTTRILSQTLKPPSSGRKLVRRIIVQQLYFTAVQALPLMLPIALLIGGLVIFQFSKVSGQYDFGRILVLFIVRELGPIITALIVILRSATAVTIEISYMQVLNETDALEMMGIDPAWLVGFPRLIGITFAIVGLFVVFDLVSILGGYALGWAVFQLPSEHLLSQIAKAVSLTDLIVGLVKALMFGVMITMVCLYRGVEIKHRMTDVPVAVSRSATECFLFCLIANVVISVLFYL